MCRIKTNLRINSIRDNSVLSFPLQVVIAAEFCETPEKKYYDQIQALTKYTKSKHHSKDTMQQPYMSIYIR